MEYNEKEINRLWGVQVDRILKVMLSDGNWYKVEGDCGEWLEIYEDTRNEATYFTFVTTEVIEIDGMEGTALKRLSGRISEIKLIEEEVS